MKTFVGRLSFTDRKMGPGTGRTLEIQGGSLPVAAGKMIRIFWKGLKTTERNDCLRSGLVMTVKERKEQQNEGN